MATCTACGTGDQLPQARFCHSCGSPLSTGCGACGAALAAGARFCSECGAPQDVVGDIARPASERRMTSILFGDLVGFTTRSESLDQEDARELLSRFFDGCRQIIDRYGGTVEKFIGDAVMAVWGVPTAHEDDAERAVRAGLELVRMVEDLSTDAGDDHLAMRVGIVTGEVAVTIGAEQQGMVAGDPVNTASRVQELASPGQVWVDQATKQLTSAAISYADAGTHEIRGKAQALSLWTARAVVGSIGGGQRADGLEAPFVGRDRELRLVKEVFHSVQETARPGLFIVDGEPGVGKSRLGWEFFKYTDGLTATTMWHQGRCVAYGEGVAFWALAEAIRLRLTRAAEGDEDDPLDVRIDAGLAALVSDDEERAWIRPRIATLLGAGAEGTFTREDLFGAWITFLERVSDGSPVVLMIDDAQYADEGLLSFIEYLTGSASFPVLVLLLTRPGLLEERPNLATNRRATVLHLDALEPRDMQRLVNGLVSGLPEEVAVALVERAEGVPLYAVETVRSLIDRDLVVPRDGEYALAEGAALDLSVIGAPASLQALVAARLDALGHDQRHAISYASILGPTFARDSLAHLCPDIDTDAALASLVQHQILSKDTNRLSAEFGQYRFVQIVVRQVAYGTLSRRDRKTGHLTTARLFETYPDAEELGSIIAQHYLDAIDAAPTDVDAEDLTRIAVDLLTRAARRSLNLGSPAEAVGHLRQAVARTTDPIGLAHLQSDLAQALDDNGAYEEARELAAHALEVLDESGDEVAAAKAAAAWGRACMMELGTDLEAVSAALRPRLDSMLERYESTPEALTLLRALLSCEGRLGRSFPEYHRLWLRLADRLEDHEQLADAYTSAAIDYGSTGAFSISRVLFSAAADLAREHHMPVSLARTLSNLTSDTIPWDLPGAVACGREAVAAARRSGVVMWKGYSAVNLLLATFSSGQWDELDAVMAASPDVGDNELGILAQVLQTVVADARGIDPPPADHLLELTVVDPVDTFWRHLLLLLNPGSAGSDILDLTMAAFDRWHEVLGLSDDVVTGWPILADIVIDTAPASYLERLLEVIDQSGTTIPLGLRGHRAFVAGRVATRDGAPAEAEAEAHLRAAVDIYDRWGSLPYAARAREVLGHLLAADGRDEAAHAMLAQARTAYTDLGAVTWLERLDQRSHATSVD